MAMEAKNNVSAINNLVGVHDEMFHQDELVALAIIEIVTGVRPEWKRFNRDEDFSALIEQGYTLIDYGKGEFDHHEAKEHKEVYSNGIFMSACGKVLREYVRCGMVNSDIAELLLNGGLYSLQASDNGQDSDKLGRFVTSPFIFVKYYNTPNRTGEEQEQAFADCYEVVLRVLRSMWAKAEQALVDLEIFKTLKVDENGIIDLPKHMDSGVTFCQMNNADVNKPKIRFFTYPNLKGGYNVQAINIVGLKEVEEELPFGGKEPKDIGVQGITFVHSSGFLGAGDDLESCHALANYNLHHS